MKLPVIIRVRPELEVRPARITFRNNTRAGKKGKPHKRVFTIVNNRGKPFQVRGLQYNEEYFEVRPLRPLDRPSRNHKFEVEQRSIKHAGGIKASGKYLFGRTGRPLNTSEKQQGKHDQSS